MKRKIFTLMFCTLFGASMLFAQDRPEGVVQKLVGYDITPEVDGVIDAFWDTLPAYDIFLPMWSGTDFGVVETPSLGDEGETYFKIAYTLDGVYVMVNVKDGSWWPSYLAGGDSYRSDKIEIYMDVNEVLEDGVGGQGSNTTGQFQFSEDPKLANDGGLPMNGSRNNVTAYKVTDGDWVWELYVPFESLVDKDGVTVPLKRKIGFDVNVADRDDGQDDFNVRYRMMWANDAHADWNGDGVVNESWNNMDDCGWMTFEDPEDAVVAEEVSISADADNINIDGGTVQMEANILPANATFKKLNWTIENETGKATINADGLVTAILNGSVIVTGTTKDGSMLSASKTITISNQVVAISDINLIINGGFDGIEGAPSGDWSGYANNGGTVQIVDGVAVFTPSDTLVYPGPDPWNMQIAQVKAVDVYNDILYHLTFDVWADEARTVYVDFEDPSNSYNRFGDSESEWAINKVSEWQVPATTEKTTVTVDFTPKRIQANSNKRFNIMPGDQMPVCYVDNFKLIQHGTEALLTPAQTSITLETVNMATSITTAGGTLQVTTTVKNLPANPVYSIVKVDGDATVDARGKVTAVGNGVVKVVGKDPVDPTVMDELEITISGQPVAVKENVANQFSIYPNPVNSELNVEMTSSNAKVVIFNSLGSKIYEETANGLTTKVDVSEFARGVYFVQVNNAPAKKFVK